MTERTTGPVSVSQAGSATAGGGAADSPHGGTLGTFLGVFTPTVLTILGVIMYLRLGWVVGQVGTGLTIAIVLTANAITLVTTLAFSSVATNVRVGIGGAYNIISRSLGLEFGGAIGLPLFLSQTLSVTLYAFGLAEALRVVWPEVPIQPAAAIIVVAVGLLALRGAGAALKVQLPLMGAIAISVAALVVGVLMHEPVTPPEGMVVEAASQDFWAVFAVFFPAVTGIMAGLGLSGDLEDPGRSLPVGAITAVLTGTAVYLALPFVLAAGATPEALRSDELIWTRIAPLGAILILPGLFGAIFSSAIGSILGAPRTLQALALDELAPRWLARTAGGAEEPLVGVIVTTLLALAAVLLGDLNAVAVVVSMFFLTVYGMVNLVAAVESLSGDPSWRPKLRVPWGVSLLGAVACLGVMFLINPLASALAILVESVLFLWLRRRERQAEWGDVRRGAYESLIRWSLVKLAGRPMTARNWRPHILVFANDIERRIDLVEFATWFAAGRGVVTVCELVVGDVLDAEIDTVARREEIRGILSRAQLTAFPEVDVVHEVVPGMVNVAQANGIAGLDSNTVIVGLPRTPDRLADFLRVLRRMERLSRSMVIGRVRRARPQARSAKRRIDVWWGGRQNNGDLMLLLAYLLNRNVAWRRAAIRILTIPPDGEDPAASAASLEELITEVRIPASPVVVSRQGTVVETIVGNSADTDVVFLGLNVPAVGHAASYAESLIQIADQLPTVFFVRNSTLFRGELV